MIRKGWRACEGGGKPRAGSVPRWPWINHACAQTLPCSAPGGAGAGTPQLQCIPPPAPARTQNAGVKHKEEPGRPERRRLQGWGGTSCSPEKCQDHVAVRRDSDSKGLRPTGWGTAPGVHPDTHAHRGWGSALPLWAPPVTGPGSRESAVATSAEQAFPEPQSLSHGTRFNQEPNPAARLT